MEECIFCKIVKGEIPSYKVYEDENFLAFLDINPLNPGHTLVIPKKHYRWVWDVENVGEYFEVVRKIAKKLQRAYKIDFVVSGIAGNDVGHAHTHVIPRFESDGHGGWLDPKQIKKMSPDEMKQIVDKLKNA